MRILSELLINIFKEKFTSITWQLIVLSFIVLILPGVPLAYLCDKSIFFEAGILKMIFLTMGFCFIVFFFNFFFLEILLQKFLRSIKLKDNILKEKILIGKSTLAMGMSIPPIYFPLIIAFLYNFEFKIYLLLVFVTNIVLVLGMFFLNYIFECQETRRQLPRNRHDHGQTRVHDQHTQMTTTPDLSERKY